MCGEKLPAADRSANTTTPVSVPSPHTASGCGTQSRPSRGLSGRQPGRHGAHITAQTDVLLALRVWSLAGWADAAVACRCRATTTCLLCWPFPPRLLMTAPGQPANWGSRPQIGDEAQLETAFVVIRPGGSPLNLGASRNRQPNHHAGILYGIVIYCTDLPACRSGLSSENVIESPGLAWGEAVKASNALGNAMLSAANRWAKGHTPWPAGHTLRVKALRLGWRLSRPNAFSVNESNILTVHQA